MANHKRLHEVATATPVAESAPALVPAAAPFPWGRRTLMVLLLLMLIGGCFAARHWLFTPGAIRLAPADAIYFDRALFPKGVSVGRVAIVGRQLFVDGKPFWIKGVGYQPTPIGKSPWDMNVYTRVHLDRDLPLLRAMGANTIRTWGTVRDRELLDACWNGGRQPIRVIMGFTIPPTLNYADAGIRQKVRLEFARYVMQFRDHPAVLMWALGNENNLTYTQSSIRDWYRLCNELGYVAYRAEGDSFHPVGIVNGALFDPTGPVGNVFSGTSDTDLPYVDVWGSNIYTGLKSDAEFRKFARASWKPVFLSEFGVDAWDNENDRLYEDEQALWTAKVWDAIVGAGVAIGGTVMAYSDEWWKDGDVNGHDRGGYTNYDGHPDHFSNEEWYGIMETVKNGDQPDTMRPRKVYYTLQKIWTAEEKAR